MLKLVNNRPFWLNALAVILLGVGLIFGTLKMLGVITKHGNILTVPNVLHTNTIAAIKLLESKGFEVLIQDSTYTDTAKLGTVLKQFPEGNNTVKVNRLILLTVNRQVLPNIDAPSLISKSTDYAIEVLTRSHFTLGDTTFEPSYMQGAVIAQNFKGVKLEPGTKIPWGSKIDLVIGAGLSDRMFLVPSLIGLTVAQAKQLLLDNRLIIASVNSYKGEAISDTANAFVVTQSPPTQNEDKSNNYIREGQIMDIWVSKVMQYIAPDTTTLASGAIDMNELLAREKENEEMEKAKAAREKQEKSDRRKFQTGKSGALPLGSTATTKPKPKALPAKPKITTPLPPAKPIAKATLPKAVGKGKTLPQAKPKITPKAKAT